MTAGQLRKTVSTVIQKETPRMPKRLPMLVVLIAAGLLTSAILLTAPVSAAPPPYWQVLDGSRPTHLWEPLDATETQELTGTKDPIFNIYAAEVRVSGEVIGCLGSGSTPPAFPVSATADSVCEGATGFPASETAAELEEMLEGPYGAGVEVTGGPAGTAPLLVHRPWEEPVELTVIKFFGVVPSAPASSRSC